VSDFLARRGASPAAVEVVVRGLSVAPAEASVLWAAWEIVAVERRGSGRPWRIVGGNDRIPDALARELGEALHVGTPVRAIDRDPPRVVTGERTLHPRAIVVAIPLPAYAAVEMAGIDRRVREAAARIPQVAQSITHFQLRAGTRLESTVAIGDGPLAWTSAADGPAPGRRAILEGWSEVFGTSALDAATGGDALATSDLVRLFPEAAGAVERVRRVSWRGVAGIGGAGAYYGPGQVERYLSLLREPEPPVFFAGDHASDRPTWTVGAIRSAERAAEDVLRYLRRAAA
jgi:monoamine oxidase